MSRRRSDKAVTVHSHPRPSDLARRAGGERRLEKGLWPSPADGVVAIAPSQMGYLLSGKRLAQSGGDVASDLDRKERCAWLLPADVIPSRWERAR